MRNKLLAIACWMLAFLDFFAVSAHAEPLSTAMALLYGGIAGGGLAGLGSYFGGRGQKAPEYGYDIVNMPTYPWAEATQESANTYLRNMLKSMESGEMPAWMSYLDPVQSGMKQDLYNQFYGTAGRPGLLRDIQGAGAISGIGPKALMSKTQQSISDYMTESDKIDQYISGLKYQTMANQSLQIPQLLAGMARGPESQIVSYGGGVGGMSGQSSLGNTMSTLAGSIPWENMFQGSSNNYSGSNYSGLNLNSGSYGLTGSLGSSGNLYDKLFSGGSSVPTSTYSPSQYKLTGSVY